MPCLLCRNFQPTEPEDHKRLRLSGNCQYSCGDRWDFATAVNYVRHHRRVLDGFCRLNPQPLPRSSADICGQIAFHLPYWIDGIHGPEERSIHTLVDWSREQMRILQDGTWDSRELDKLREEAPELRRQLKIARKRSAARLAKLKRLRSAKPICENIVEKLPDVISIPHLMAKATQDLGVINREFDKIKAAGACAPAPVTVDVACND